MAKMSKRRSSGRKKRATMDWIVNDDTYGNSASVGNLGLVAVPLTYPQMQQNINTFGVAGPVGGWTFPEQNQRVFVKTVVGHISVVPSVWAVGSSFQWLARIVIKPMDLVTGQAIADSLYSLVVSEYANERYSWQKYARQRQDLGSVGEVTFVKANVNRYLEPDEAVFLMFENVSGMTQDLLLTMYLRTLVAT